jgi:hypothetical protein
MSITLATPVLINQEDIHYPDELLERETELQVATYEVVFGSFGENIIPFVDVSPHKARAIHSAHQFQPVGAYPLATTHGAAPASDQSKLRLGSRLRLPP